MLGMHVFTVYYVIVTMFPLQRRGSRATESFGFYFVLFYNDILN